MLSIYAAERTMAKYLTKETKLLSQCCLSVSKFMETIDVNEESAMLAWRLNIGTCL